MSSTARLRIIQVTDCYTLVNFPSLKTLIKQKRAEMTGNQLNGNTFCISMIHNQWLQHAMKINSTVCRKNIKAT